jgi:hypothetical protein
MQFIVFTDPRYHAEQHVELDPAQIAGVEEKTVRLFMDGKHQVTVVTLQNGERHTLAGFVAQQIARAKSYAAQAPAE